MSHRHRAGAAVLGAAALLLPLTLGSAAHADVPQPSDWYTTGADALASYAHGEVIASRDLELSLNDATGTPLSIPGTQLLYRTRNALGGDSETVTTVLQPAGPSKGVVAYLSYYDGLSSTCDPSVTLQSATPDNEKYVIGVLLSEGFTVTVPDFEGESLDWAAGHEAGWDTLDAITATESHLGLDAATTKVGMLGYSGGSIAGEWAAEIAPTYAPDLDIIGTAIGGIPANLTHVMRYVDSAADTDRDSWVGVIPAAMASLGRAYGDDFTDYLSDEGKAAVASVSTQCIGAFADSYAGKHVADFVKPGVDFLAEPDVTQIVDGLVMGRGHLPTTPMLMFQSNHDGTGDGVMVAADVKALATKYCAAGLPVIYSTDTAAHAAAGADFMQRGILYLLGRFAPTAPPVAPDNCSSLLPKPPAPPKAITATLAGHSTGRKDVLVVTAKGAQGASVQLFRSGHASAIARGRIGATGKVTFSVADRNGRATTRYHAHVAATKTTKAAGTRTISLR